MQIDKVKYSVAALEAITAKAMQKAT